MILDMDIFILCEKIKLQSKIKSRVIEFANDFDFSSVAKQLMLFSDYEKMA